MTLPSSFLRFGFGIPTCFSLARACAHLELRVLQDCSDIATQHWKIQTNDLPGVMELQSCKTSLSVVTDAINSFANPDADAKLLNLTIPNFDSFSAKDTLPPQLV